MGKKKKKCCDKVLKKGQACKSCPLIDFSDIVTKKKPKKKDKKEKKKDKKKKDKKDKKKKKK